jgi:hypothetical protein
LTIPVLDQGWQIKVEGPMLAVEVRKLESFPPGCSERLPTNHHHGHANSHRHRPASAGRIKLAGEIKPDAIILGGDFLHHTGLLPYGRTQQLTSTQCAVELHGIEVPLMFVRGNHEDENWFEFRDAWKSLHTSAPVRLNGRRRSEHGWAAACHAGRGRSLGPAAVSKACGGLNCITQTSRSKIGAAHR